MYELTKTKTLKLIKKKEKKKSWLDEICFFFVLIKKCGLRTTNKRFDSNEQRTNDQTANGSSQNQSNKRKTRSF